LSEDQARATLDQRRPIEQLLPVAGEGDEAVIEWQLLSPRTSGMVLVRHRVEDVGTADFLDVYEFPAVDPDEEHGEGRVLATFDGSSEALARSSEHGARPDRWVNGGVIEDEYADTKRQ
jgi:hypothetical protein